MCIPTNITSRPTSWVQTPTALISEAFFPHDPLLKPGRLSPTYMSSSKRLKPHSELGQPQSEHNLKSEPKAAGVTVTPAVKRVTVVDGTHGDVPHVICGLDYACMRRCMYQKDSYPHSTIHLPYKTYSKRRIASVCITRLFAKGFR